MGRREVIDWENRDGLEEKSRGGKKLTERKRRVNGKVDW